MPNYLFFILLFVTAMFSGCSKADGVAKEEGDSPSPIPTPTPEVVDAMTFAKSLGIGWNLGNSLDAHANGKSNETCWGNGKATQATFDAVKKMGFSSVRIPVTWMGHIGPAPDYKIEKAWLDRVAEVAGYAKKAGLKAIVNIHHDGGASNANGAPSYSQGVWLRIADAVADQGKDKAMKEEITCLWQQIAERFRNEGDWLIFETFNEIHDGFWGWPVSSALYAKMNEWNQTAVNAIRSVGGENSTRFIAVPCYAANPQFAVNAQFSLPKDEVKDRLLVAVHTYDPYEYAGAASTSEWGHTASTTNASYRESYLGNILTSLYKRFISRGIPVYFGEFGCVHRSKERDEQFRKYYLEYNIKNMRDNNMPVMIWDNGVAGSGAEKFGLINHSTGTFIRNTDIDDAKEIVELMVKAWTTADPGYTLNSIYNRAPK